MLGRHRDGQRFGINTGDIFAFRSGLGIPGGIPIPAAVVAVAFLLERRDEIKHEAWSWLVIIPIRTGATNSADYVCGRRFVNVDRILFSMVLVVCIAIMAVLLLSGKGGLTQTIYFYWLTLCVARTAGTAIADVLAENETLDVGLPLSTTITGIVFVGVLVLWKSRPRSESQSNRSAADTIGHVGKDEVSISR